MAHGNVNLKLVWEVPIEDLNYDPLLVVCFEGLRELSHPYKFIAYQCCIEILQATNSKNKVIMILPKLIKHLRDALNSKYESVCLKGVEITKLLSSLVEDRLNPYIKFFIQPINRLVKNM